MAKKIFTDESLSTFINEIKTYTDTEVEELASGVAFIDENDNETVTLESDLTEIAMLIGGDA